MPRITPLTAEARMDQQFVANIEKYRILANIKRSGDLGQRIGTSATTANKRLRTPGKFTLTELRRLVRALRIPPEDIISAIYDK